MNQLIWFSIPGSLIVAGLVCARQWPEIESSGSGILTAGAVPVVGFIFHQAFRCVFEKWFGFDSPCRRVIQEICDKWPNENLGENRAFLVWETTFYGIGFPEGFREHDRRAWHYIISFWSSAAAGIFAFILSLSSSRIFGLLFLFSAVVLGIKGYLTWDSLCDQEIHIFRRHSNLFTESKNALCKKDYVPQESRQQENNNEQEN